MKFGLIRNLLFIVLSLSLLSACVGKKKYLEMEAARNEVQAKLDKAKEDLKNCEEEKAALEEDLKAQIAAKETEIANEKQRADLLAQQLDDFRKANTNLLERLRELSVINQTSAESIARSLDALNGQSEYIQNLTTTVQEKNELLLKLVTSLKQSLANVDDSDVTVEVKKGVVYISLSDKMLFRSGSSRINKDAKEVLGKIASILNAHPELDILVEGHTDNVPIRTDNVRDNWDLSVKRATAVVRHLQDDHGVASSRMTAGGRSEFVPKASNETADGRSQNRRTEIIILPKLDQLFELVTP